MAPFLCNCFGGAKQNPLNNEEEEEEVALPSSSTNQTTLGELLAGSSRTQNEEELICVASSSRTQIAASNPTPQMDELHDGGDKRKKNKEEGNVAGSSRTQNEEEGNITSSPRTQIAGSSSNPTPQMDENLVLFSYDEIVHATNNFSEGQIIGKGGFGTVYRGTLSTGQTVALKKARKSLEGERQLVVEISMLKHIHHQNIVRLLGYCSQGGGNILVYEFLPSGDLNSHIHGLASGVPLDWNTRVQIALGTAKALSYLHKQMPPVIYLDLKLDNILLDGDLKPKLCDFGSSKLGPVPQDGRSFVSSQHAGTFGYFAPEYGLIGRLTIKQDIYSFGVVLLEIISGQKALDFNREESEVLLANWVANNLNKRKYTELADPALNGNYRLDQLEKLFKLGADCVKYEPHERPTADEILLRISNLEGEEE